MPMHTCSYFPRMRSVRQTNSGGVHKLAKYNRFCTGMDCAKRRCARISWRTGPVGRHDRFHESPSPHPRAPVSYFPVPGPCVDRAALVHLRLRYTVGGVPGIVCMTFITGGVISIKYIFRAKRVSNCYMQENKN